MDSSLIYLQDMHNKDATGKFKYQWFPDDKPLDLDDHKVWEWLLGPN